MRIAIVAPLVTAIREPQLGGAQAMVADLAAGLTARGHQIDVYAASGSSIPGVRVIDTGVDPRSLAGLLYRVGRPASAPADSRAAALAFVTVYAAVRQVAYDVVHNHAFDPPAVRRAIGLPFPVVHTIHLPPDPAVAAAIAEARRSPDPPTVAGVSTSQAAAWEIVAPLDTILPDGVPVDRIPWSESSGDRVMFAGRFSPEKGPADAIEIARLAGVDLDLYGEPYDVEYARSSVESHRGEPGVAIHGGLPRAELWRAMARSRAVLCPVKWDEPFGMVAAEAQAAGTPVIAYRRGALSQTVVDGRTGFLVSPDDVDAAAHAIEAIPSIQRSACRRHAEAHLNLDASLDAHERLYERLGSATRTARHA
jgi:UDP-glucose:tetrahydrobiopterin glucosyltransferase